MELGSAAMSTTFSCFTCLLLVALFAYCSCQTLEDALESEITKLPFRQRPVLALCSTAEWQLKLRDLIKDTDVHIAEVSIIQ